MYRESLTEVTRCGVVSPIFWGCTRSSSRSIFIRALLCPIHPRRAFPPWPSESILNFWSPHFVLLLTLVVCCYVERVSGRYCYIFPRCGCGTRFYIANVLFSRTKSGNDPSLSSSVGTRRARQLEKFLNRIVQVINMKEECDVRNDYFKDPPYLRTRETRCLRSSNRNPCVGATADQKQKN